MTLKFGPARTDSVIIAGNSVKLNDNVLHWEKNGVLLMLNLSWILQTKHQHRHVS